MDVLPRVIVKWEQRGKMNKLKEQIYCGSVDRDSPSFTLLQTKEGEIVSNAVSFIFVKNKGANFLF